MRNLILIPVVFLCTNAYSQSHKTALDTLENHYQQCLGNSHSMYNCAATYYKQLDSLLHHTLQQLYSSLAPGQQQQLRIEQGAWEEKKDEYFKKIDERVEKMHKRTMDGLDDDMISTDNKAAFLKARVATLLNI
ncbi:lysozyme inhibitor LprI family protein [Chitinophaga sp. 22321]|uniref:DUF1311 domain-containing protein n=1 Tax=Chitinophaga hostae TaxID=2831022 RepID=A0ABS5ISI5_9BACT|nr:lysozyme inhibitor LprI family protein [Chitinophaga hostae]MBS0025901.1 DUF1311 domain-containing protein [Chitinophaga hostae]